MKSGLEMSDRQCLDTDLNRNKDLAGRVVKVKTRRSCGQLYFLVSGRFPPWPAIVNFSVQKKILLYGDGVETVA